MPAWQAMMVLGSAPVVRRQAAVRSGNFVGRLGELRSLEAAWLAAGADGAAPVIVVYGESGIGKTRTVAEFARAVQARGAGGCARRGELPRDWT
jgi:Cdc6-like AAA superfamily ATPase